MFSQPKLSNNDIETYIHRLVNAERRNHNLSELAYDPRLAYVALGHSSDMARRNYFDHRGRDGSDASERAMRAGYPYVKRVGNLNYTGIGENIFACGINKSTRTEIEEIRQGNRVIKRNTRVIEDPFTSIEVARLAVNNWMSSEGHRRNILTPHYNREGIGIASSASMIYVTQNFY